jgi:hypothetical protein
MDYGHIKGKEKLNPEDRLHGPVDREEAVCRKWALLLSFSNELERMQVARQNAEEQLHLEVMQEQHRLLAGSTRQ